METGRNRLSVTADAYGLTNPGTRRSLASRPPYRTALEAESPGRLLLSLYASIAGWDEEEPGGPVPAVAAELPQEQRATLEEVILHVRQAVRLSRRGSRGG